PCQMDALISLAFNVGPGAPQSVYNLINECNFKGAADEFLKYNKAKGKVLPGLTARRQREREIFLNCSYPNRKAAHIPCCEYTVTAIDAVNKGSKYKAQCRKSCSKGGACYGV
ncbi:MAG: lysozyme, partial [Acidithiobacillus sp.]|nr:lysozyme [Acidithiobacillus sp.]